MSYQLFDPTQPCTSLLPLNPVENRLTFYKVSVFEVSLEDIADIADLPVAYAWPGAAQKGSKARMRLGLPISTLFPELREKYQEVRLADASGKKIPVVVSLEGSFLPFDPKRPVPAPLPEHPVSLHDVTKGRIKVGSVTITLDKRDQRRLAIEGVALVKVNDRTARAAARYFVAGARTFGHCDDAPLSRVRNGRVATRRSIQPISSPSDRTKCRTTSMTKPCWRCSPIRASGVSGFTGTERMAKAVSQLPAHMYRGVLRSYKNDPRFIDLMLRYRRGPLGAVHSRPKLPRYDIGLFTAFEQTWTLQGYSRGSLVNSLTLGPEEELTIEIFTFDRRKVEEERTLTSEFERNSEVSSMTNITSNMARELSETNQMSGDIGLGLPLGAGGVPVDLSVGGSASNEVKADIQASMDQVSEVTSRVSERVKSMRQVKVLEARETGREDRVTREIPKSKPGLRAHAQLLRSARNLQGRLRAQERQAVLPARRAAGPRRRRCPVRAGLSGSFAAGVAEQDLCRRIRCGAQPLRGRGGSTMPPSRRRRSRRWLTRALRPRLRLLRRSRSSSSAGSSGRPSPSCSTPI